MRDADVRAAARKQLLAMHENDPSTLIVEEMGLWSGSVRIDIAVINGELSGIELKSNRDTLQRLPLQADIYSRIFDRVNLIVGDRHAAKAERIVPAWWGMQTAKVVDDEICLEDVRRSQPNPSQDPYLLAQLLWKDEAVGVLANHGLARGMASKRVKDIHQRLSNALTLEQLGAAVRQRLKQRSAWLGQTRPNPLDVAVHP